MGKLFELFKKKNKATSVTDAELISPSLQPSTPILNPSEDLAPSTAVEPDLQATLPLPYTDQAQLSSTTLQPTQLPQMPILNPSAVASSTSLFSAPTPHVELPTVIHPTLIPIANALLGIPTTKELGVKLQSFLYNPALTKDQLASHINEIDQIIHSQQSVLSNLKDTLDLLSEHQTLCSFLSNQVVSSETPTHENFSTLNIFDLVRKEAALITHMKHLLPALFNHSTNFDLNDLLTQYNTSITSIGELTSIVENFTVTSDTLRNDILSYTNIVNQMQSKNTMSVDWNKKKSALVSLKQELEGRRNVYIQDETALNNQIQSFYQQVMTLHSTFQTISPYIIQLLGALAKDTPPDLAKQAEREKVIELISKVQAIRLQLNQYVNSL